MRRIGGMMVGSQTGAAIGALAREVATSTDVGLPLGPEGTAALLPAGVAEFGEGLSISADEVRLFLALREAAHHRLFGHVPWLRAHLFGAVEEYARGITVDASRLREAMPQIDPANPEALQEALSGAALFQPEDTPQQKAALSRLETALALVEGWVTTVVDEAAGNRLPQATALAEAIRRRRATGGPAERTFATLVGLELRPRKLREAALIWRQLTDVRGTTGRDAVWAHPDLLPTEEDFDDPDGFVHGRQDWDISALEEATGAAGSEGAAGEEPPAGGDEPEGGPRGRTARRNRPADRAPGSGPRSGAAGPAGGVIPRRPRRWVTGCSRYGATRSGSAGPAAQICFPQAVDGGSAVPECLSGGRAPEFTSLSRRHPQRRSMSSPGYPQRCPPGRLTTAAAPS